MRRPGIFITFEGSEGCGKTTQIERLARSLRAAGRTVVVTREPGGTPVGEQIRHVLQHSRDSEAMTPEAELLLFAASRAQLVRECIEPALAEGADVISDRFLDSTTVYQGVARRLSAADVRRINDFAVGDCRPDVTFILDLQAAEARARVFDQTDRSAKPDRIEREPLDFYERVRAGYLELAAGDPARFHLLDGAQSRDALAAQILHTVLELIHGIPAAARA
ncbi:MAG: dTMP kinase [Terrimicrobiaceae bacterium]|nr:dTMP kinase [Terrimicrobiaceae bacterium]